MQMEPDCHGLILPFCLGQGNYVLERDDLVDLQREEYDVILALSISKWIHLNWGDEGLKRTFRRIFLQLRPGGKLVLEPQEWSSYKRKKKLTVFSIVPISLFISYEFKSDLTIKKLHLMPELSKSDTVA